VNVSRAGFLKVCVGALLGRTVDVSSLFASIGGAVAGGSWTPFRVEDASAALFGAHVNSTFVVRTADDRRVPLVLARVTDRPLTPGIEQYSLGFQAPPDASFSQGTYALEHATLGTFDLFIAPVGGGSVHGAVYEACLSRHATVQHAGMFSGTQPDAPGGGTA
jgi:hypothetical protein